MFKCSWVFIMSNNYICSFLSVKSLGFCLFVFAEKSNIFFAPTTYFCETVTAFISWLILSCFHISLKMRVIPP